MDDAGTAADPLPRSSGRRRPAGRTCATGVSWEVGPKVPNLCVLVVLPTRFPGSGTLPATRTVPFRWTALSAFAITPSPREFLFEGVRDAFGPEKTF